jgi:hypothetical protein
MRKHNNFALRLLPPLLTEARKFAEPECGPVRVATLNSALKLGIPFVEVVLRTYCNHLLTRLFRVLAERSQIPS